MYSFNKTPHLVLAVWHNWTYWGDLKITHFTRQAITYLCWVWKLIKGTKVSCQLNSCNMSNANLSLDIRVKEWMEITACSGLIVAWWGIYSSVNCHHCFRYWLLTCPLPIHNPKQVALTSCQCTIRSKLQWHLQKNAHFHARKHIWNDLQTASLSSPNLNVLTHRSLMMHIIMHIKSPDNAWLPVHYLTANAHL